MTAVQRKSLAISLSIHIILVLVLMYFYITTPIPPWAEGLAGGGGGGSFVEFGTIDFTQPENAQPQPAVTAQVSKEEEILTSETEETINITVPEKKQPREKTESEKERVKEVKNVTKPVVALPKVEVRKPDPKALYKPGNKGQGGSPNGSQPGDGTGGSGSGSGGGDGSGTGPGKGSGTGGGEGSGNGPGKGAFSFDLSGRLLVQKPSASNPTQEGGNVVIAIIVNKYGKVVSATGPERGSTTSNATLVKVARDAAMTAKFNASTAGVEEQRGTITFRFIVR